jgi:hypothetical protein
MSAKGSTRRRPQSRAKKLLAPSPPMPSALRISQEWTQRDFVGSATGECRVYLSRCGQCNTVHARPTQSTALFCPVCNDVRACFAVYLYDGLITKTPTDP